MNKQTHPDTLIAQFIPDLSEGKTLNLNLDTEARKWARNHPQFFNNQDPSNGPSEDNPLSNAAFCQSFIDEIHREYDISWSWGGYREDRSFLWESTYLRETQGFIHLGIDVNAPAGTRVACPLESRVLRVDNDHPLNWGWGPRLFLEPQKASQQVLIIAHLEDILVKPDDIIPAGKIVAAIGRPPFNGNWIPHIHLQVISKKYFLEVKDNLDQLDGYARADSSIFSDGSLTDPLELLQS